MSEISKCVRCGNMWTHPIAGTPCPNCHNTSAPEGVPEPPAPLTRYWAATLRTNDGAHGRGSLPVHGVYLASEVEARHSTVILENAALAKRIQELEATVATLRAQLSDLRAEHRCCLVGDTAWAEKWKAKYEEVKAAAVRAGGVSPDIKK